MPYPITLAVTLIRAAPQNQSFNASYDVFPSPEISSSSNTSTTPVITLANTQLLTLPDIPLAPETFFTNAGPISDLNNRP